MDLNELKQFAPGGKSTILSAIADKGPSLFEQFEITTPLRLCHFLAQVAHESDGFHTTTEYASGNAYEGRANLGNTHRGDGRLYRGRGLIQCTGRSNYRTFTAWAKSELDCDINFVAHPEKVATFPWALLSALWFWDSHHLSGLADQNNLRAITRVINGGTNGLIDRQYWFKKAWEIWGDDDDINHAGEGKSLFQSKLVAAGSVLGGTSISSVADMSGYGQTIWGNVRQVFIDIPLLAPTLLVIVAVAIGWIFYHRYRQSEEYEN